MTTHRVVGLSVDFDRPPAARLHPGGPGPVDVSYAVTTDPPSAAGNRLVYRSKNLVDGQPACVLHHDDEGAAHLTFHGIGTFAIDAEGSTVRASEHDAAPSGALELRFLGSVLAHLSEQRGRLALHGSAVVLGDGTAVAALGPGGVGKTTLALDAVAQGAALLTDDLLVLERRDGRWWVLPTGPEMRVTAAQADAVGIDAESLSEVVAGSPKRRLVAGAHLGVAADEPVPLDVVLTLGRGSGRSPVVQPSEGVATVFRLLTHTFLPALGEAMGWRGRRLDDLIDLVDSTSVLSATVPDRSDGPCTLRDILSLAD